MHNKKRFYIAVILLLTFVFTTKVFASLTLGSTDITGTDTLVLTGGSAVGSNITYKSTTGTGTATGIAHQFTGGTNGGTAAMTILNNGNVGIGLANPTSKFQIDVDYSDTDLASSKFGFNGQFDGTVTSEGSAHMEGILLGTTSKGGPGGYWRENVAIEGIANHSGSQMVGSLYGIAGGAGLIGSGMPINAAGVVGYIYYSDVGTFVRAAALYAISPVAGSGTSTAMYGYGLKIDEQTSSRVTTAYQIYSGGVAPSYYAGPINFGSSGSLNAGTSDSSFDVGLKRLSAGVWKVTNASSGYGGIDAGSYSVSGTAGMTTVITVRKDDDSGTCTLTFTGGILTATTCSHT